VPDAAFESELSVGDGVFRRMKRMQDKETPQDHVGSLSRPSGSFLTGGRAGGRQGRAEAWEWAITIIPYFGVI
jgi:hypothetical protein